MYAHSHTCIPHGSQLTMVLPRHWSNLNPRICLKFDSLMVLKGLKFAYQKAAVTLMYDRQSACPNKYYWLSTSVEISVTYYYCRKMHVPVV